MNIIQHHEPIDFEALFKQAESATIGIDGRDLETFAVKAVEIHSFFGNAEREDRVENAIGAAIDSKEAMKIIARSNAFLFIIRHSLDCERPITVDEVSAINKFVSGLPEGSDIQWSLMQDSTLGNKVDIIMLCNVKR